MIIWRKAFLRIGSAVKSGSMRRSRTASKNDNVNGSYIVKEVLVNESVQRSYVTC
jgi:hypothetical protein